MVDITTLIKLNQKPKSKQEQFSLVCHICKGVIDFDTVHEFEVHTKNCQEEIDIREWNEVMDGIREETYRRIQEYKNRMEIKP